MGKETESHGLPTLLRLCSTYQIDKKHWSDIANRWWTFGVKGVLGVAAILTFVVISNLFYEALFKRSVVIEPISMPKDMEDRGYTRDVAAVHLREALNRYARHAHTGDAGPKLALDVDPPDFVVPTVGLSFKAIVAQIRTFFHIEHRQNISGEITHIDGKLRLRLLKNEVVIHESWSEQPHDKDLESPDWVDDRDLKALKTLFDRGALGVFAATRPYFEAVANFDKNPEAAFELANRIIADRPSREDVPSGRDVVWARNLLGLLLYQRGQLSRAVAEFNRVIRDPGFRGHDPRLLAIAHLNLGRAYEKQGDAELAIKELHTAIGIRPELGTAHLKLGDVLNQMGDAEEAKCEYLKAIAIFHQDVESDPLSAMAHQRLGDALNNSDKAANCAFHDKNVLTRPYDMLNHLHNKSLREHLVDYDNAMAEYQRAADRDPDDAHFHYDLGVKWLDRGEVDKSIDELLKAFDIRYDLGVKWFKRGEVNKSIDKLLEALDREGPNDTFDGFKYVLLKKLSEARGIKDGNDARAISLFDRAVYENNKALNDKEENGNALAYNRLGTDFYLMGKFETAVEAHDKAIDIDETYLAHKIDRGHALFALGKFDDAAKDFHDALLLPLGQADTMRWLSLSLEHSRDMHCNEYYEQKGRDHPNPCASNLDIQFVEDVLKNSNEADKCKPNFYIGEWYALHKQSNEADHRLKEAKEKCPFDSVERLAAREELKRLGPLGQEVAAMGASPGISRVPRRSRR